MGKRPKKKIFLFLVEGVSDRNALEVPFGQLLEDIDPDIVLEFAMLMQDDGSFGGDITSKNGIHPDNIERFIDEIMVSPLLKRTGLYPKDIVEIIHFVDMDGAYIDDNLVVTDGGNEAGILPGYHCDGKSGSREGAQSLQECESGCAHFAVINKDRK